MSIKGEGKEWSWFADSLLSDANKVEYASAKSHAEAVRQDVDWCAIFLGTIIGMGRVPEADVTAARIAIKDYGSLGAVLGAPFYEIAARAGIGPSGATNISRAKKVITDDAYREFQDKPVIGNFDKLIKYLTFQSGYLLNEEVRLLCLGVNKHLLSDVRLTSGTSVRVSIDAFTVMEAALKGSARAIVIVHNHPSGDPEPSSEDRIMTSNIADACRLLDMDFLDHLIVAKTRWFSFRQAGLL